MKKRYLALWILVALVVLFHIAWVANYLWYHYKWETKLMYDRPSKMYYLNEGGYTYSIGMPTYPTFTGNLVIAQNPQYGDGTVSVEYDELLIWPSLFGNGEEWYGYTKLQPIPDTDEYSSDEVDFYMDTQGRVLSAEDESAYAEYEAAVRAIRQRAKDVFGDW